MSDEDAATFGVGVITIGQSVGILFDIIPTVSKTQTNHTQQFQMYQSLGLPLPGEGKYDGYFLVYGGSSGMGTLAIQYAKL